MCVIFSKRVRNVVYFVLFRLYLEKKIIKVTKQFVENTVNWVYGIGPVGEFSSRAHTQQYLLKQLNTNFILLKITSFSFAIPPAFLFPFTRNCRHLPAQRYLGWTFVLVRRYFQFSEKEVFISHFLTELIRCSVFLQFTVLDYPAYININM